MSTWFQGLFHPPCGVLFTFPSRYLFAIGRLKSLALESGLPSFPQDCTCLVVLRIQAQILHVIATGLSPPLVALSNAFAFVLLFVACPTTPPIPKNGWFGLLPVRSPLLRESRLISFRRATEMFQFTRCPPSWSMCSTMGIQTSLWMGCPIRNLRVHRLYAAPPERFAGLRVLLRLQAPRHPPRTLSNLFSHVALCKALCETMCLRWVISLAREIGLI